MQINGGNTLPHGWRHDGTYERSWSLCFDETSDYLHQNKAQSSMNLCLIGIDLNANGAVWYSNINAPLRNAVQREVCLKLSIINSCAERSIVQLYDTVIMPSTHVMAISKLVNRQCILF